VHPSTATPVGTTPVGSHLVAPPHPLLLAALPGIAEAVAPPTELSHDRTSLDPDTVLASQRWRLLLAAARTMAEQGYATTTIARITSVAGVSKKTFYAHFGSKEAAFLACYDAVGPALAAVIESARGLQTVRRTVEAVVSAYLGVLASAPALTRLFLFEALTATPAIRQRRAATVTWLADAVGELLDELGAGGESLPELDRAQIVALLGGVNELCVVHLADQEPASLPGLGQSVTAFVLRFLSHTDPTTADG